jgi:hypothetical protein
VIHSAIRGFHASFGLHWQYVPELKVETQFQNSGTWLSRRAKGLVAAAGAVSPKESHARRSKLQPLSFTHSSAIIVDTRLHDHPPYAHYLRVHLVLFILIVVLTIPSRSRDCFRIALPALRLARKQGLIRLILKHSNIPRILHLPLLYHHLSAST